MFCIPKINLMVRYSVLPSNVYYTRSPLQKATQCLVLNKQITIHVLQNLVSNATNRVSMINYTGMYPSVSECEMCFL